MATLVQDCPHCGARHSSFTVISASKHLQKRNTWNALAICPNCGDPICALIHDGGTNAASNGLHGDLYKHDTSSVQSVFPQKTKSLAPDHLPEAAKKAFIEGAESLKDGRYNAAVAMYRRTIDVGLKEFNDDVRAWKLDKRIDKFAEAGLITKDIQEWAHKIRLEGNEALHELADVTKEQATELHMFTELLLIYLFTLPHRVQAEKRDA